MQLSKNFSLAELTASETALRKGIDNTPSKEVIDNLVLLATHVLQPMRDWYGKSVNITSGYRSVAVNKAIGGSKTSEHCFGMAADFTITKGDYKKVFDYIRNKLSFGQLIWEFGTEEAPDWIHVSYNKSNNRKQVLVAKKVKGKTIYTPL